MVDRPRERNGKSSTTGWLRTVLECWPIYCCVWPLILARRALINLKSSVQREIFHNFSELLADDPVIKIEEFDGEFSIDSRSDLFKSIVTHRRYEPKLAECALKNVDINRDAIDVGANVGFYTVLLGKALKNGRILSIEPVPDTILRLKRNIDRNNISHKTILFEGLAANRSGSVGINVIEGKQEYSSLGKIMHPSVAKEPYVSLAVESVTLDELTRKYQLDPGFIKIDAEGSEGLVIDGSRTVMKENRPTLLVEFSNLLLEQQGSSVENLMSKISQYDYMIVDPINYRPLAAHKQGGEMLCLPK